MKSWKCRFSLDHYQEILEYALNHGVTFVSLRDVPLNLPAGQIILMRHDIDFSVHAALRMAHLEHALGIRATYCVLLHSPLYNVGEPGTCGMLREIVDHGHEIALHYDLEFCEQNGVDPCSDVKAEVQYLECILGTRIVSVAQHKPATFGRCEGLAESYIDSYVQPSMQGLQYISDSGRKWRAVCVHESLGACTRLQVLIHPEWWSDDDNESSLDIIERLTDTRQNETSLAMLEYARSLETYLRDRPRLDDAWKESMQAQYAHLKRNHTQKATDDEKYT